MPKVGRTADKIPWQNPQTIKAQLKRSLSSADALKVLRILEGQSLEGSLSSGIDPGPCGFDWEAL